MHTKSALGCILGMFVVQGLRAQPTAHFNLNVSMVHERSDRGTLRPKPTACGRFTRQAYLRGNPPHRFSNNAGNGTYSATRTIHYPVYADRGGGLRTLMRQLTGQIDVTQQANTQKIKVTLSERRGAPHSRDYSYTCRGGEVLDTHSDDQITGTFRIGYTFPQNTWAVKVKRVKTADLFVINNGQNAHASRSVDFINSLNGTSLNGVSEQEFVLWGKPGSFVYQEYSWREFSAGDPIKGEIELQFTPLPVQASAQRPITEIVRNLQCGTLQVLAGRMDPRVCPPGDHGESFLTDLLAIATVPNQMRTLIQNLSSADLRSLSENLYLIANSLPRQRIAPDWLWNFKAAATIASHELGLTALELSKPFCQDVELPLAYSGGSVTAPRGRTAGHLIALMHQRLESFNVDPHLVFLRGLSEHLFARRTFANVRNTPRFEGPFTTAFDLLRRSIDTQRGTIASVLEEFEELKLQLGSIGTLQRDQEQILSELKALSELERTFNQEFAEFLQKFSDARREPIQIDSLNEKISQLQFGRDQLLNRLGTTFGFLDVGSSPGGSSLSELMQSLISHHIQVLSQPLGEPVEKLRQAVYQEARSRRAIQDVRACVGEGR